MGANLAVELVGGRRSTQDVPGKPAPTLKDHSVTYAGFMTPAIACTMSAHRDCLVNNCRFPAGVSW